MDSMPLPSRHRVSTAVRVAPTNRAEDRLDRVMAAAARPKAIGLRFKPRPPTRVPGHRGRRLARALSAMTGIPSGRRRPLAFGTNTPLTGRVHTALPVLHPSRPARPSGRRAARSCRRLRPSPAARVDLRDPPHAQQGVRTGAEHELLQIPGSCQVSPACVAVKMRCRSRRTSSSARCQSTASQPSASSSGPFTIRCPTCPSGPGPAASSPHRLTWPRQHPSGVRAAARIRPVIAGRTAEGHAIMSRVSRCISATGIRFGHPVPAGRSAFLTVSHRPCRSGSRRGFHVPHN